MSEGSKSLTETLAAMSSNGEAYRSISYPDNGREPGSESKPITYNIPGPLEVFKGAGQVPYQFAITRNGKRYVATFSDVLHPVRQDGRWSMPDKVGFWVAVNSSDNPQTTASNIAEMMQILEEELTPEQKTEFADALARLRAEAKRLGADRAPAWPYARTDAAPEPGEP